MIEWIHVEEEKDLQEIRALFVEYARSLNFNLCFQSFEQELAELPGAYAKPSGRLILCRVDGKAAGCVALKQLEPSICEMKRLFVRPDFRQQQLGRKLALNLIEEAGKAGYRVMRLDTIRGAMDRAITLYHDLGFKEIPAYSANPIPNAVYFELRFKP